MGRLGTKAELQALAAAALTDKHLASLYEKLTKVKPVHYHAPVAQIEAALVATSNGVVLPVTGGNTFWAIQSQRYGDVHATVDDANLIGYWITRQGWMQGRSYTIDTLIKWWPSWLAKAKAEAAGGTTTEDTRKDWSGE